MELADKIIVVTGAASGIGRALAIRFKAEGAQRIVCVDINAAGASATADAIDGVSMVADVTQEADILRVIEDTERGLAAASAAGMRCIVIPNALSETGNFEKAELVLDSMQELSAILEL